MEQFIRDGSSVYIQQDISKLCLYDKAVAIVNFVKKSTIKLENYLDIVLSDILKGYGINTLPNTKSALKVLLNDLYAKKQIEIQLIDLYSEKNYYGCEYVGVSKNKMTVMLEGGSILTCGVKVVIKKGGKVLDEYN